jgi:hypothetical protein
MSAHRTSNVERSASGVSTGVAPRATTAIWWLVKYGAGRMTSSPGSTSVVSASVNAWFAPAVMMMSSAPIASSAGSPLS